MGWGGVSIIFYLKIGFKVVCGCMLSKPSGPLKWGF